MEGDGKNSLVIKALLQRFDFLENLAGVPPSKPNAIDLHPPRLSQIGPPTYTFSVFRSNDLEVGCFCQTAGR